MRRRRLLGRIIPIKNHTHKFIRYATNDVNLDLTAGSAPNQVFLAQEFKLSDVMNSSEFTNLYDQFRIIGVKVYMDWTPYTGGAVVVTDALAPVVQLFPDYDDAATPTENAFRSRAIVKHFRMNNGTKTYFFKPAVLGVNYETAVASAYTPKWNTWLDVADSATPHYSLKFWAKGVDGLNVGKVNLRFKYYLEMKTSR